MSSQFHSAGELPERFVRVTVQLFGDAGAAWLRSLPALLAEFTERWSLSLHEPFAAPSYNYVVPATRADGEPVVLKMGFPNPELTCEIEALRWYDGHGSARLLDGDAERGALLLERLVPGQMLSEIDDEQATAIAASVMRQLWRPAPNHHNFPTVAKWHQGVQRLRDSFDGGTGPLPAAFVDRAEKLTAELLASAAEPVLLHGDLHHFNILSAQRQPWLAIDPKGVLGEPAYEVGPLFLNPSPQPARVQARRADQLAAELGIDRQRILGWGVARAVLAACWSIEDSGSFWGDAIECAETLAGLM
jgi:streptomycin 6-kinase